jgi:hypothetical protein
VYLDNCYCGYDIGNQPSVEWQRPVTIFSVENKNIGNNIHIVMDLINALSGNSSVNTNRSNNRMEMCVLCGPLRAKARRYRKSVARQRSCKHTSTTMGGVFRVVRAKELS